MQLPILSGIYTDAGPDIRTSYPVNMMPAPKVSGISNGFLRPADGIVKNGDGPGIDRGGINWRGECYRVMGSKLCRIAANGAVTVLGDVGSGPPVVMDYGFDRLCIVSAPRAYYWDGAALTQITDADLGPVISVCWIDGYFFFTDGEALIVTDLNDPTAVNPLKYGSSEADPDPVVAVTRLRDEAWAINRYTMEVFDNIGTQYFPFQRIDGAQVQKGAIGTYAWAQYLERVAFLGSGRNEPPAVYIAENGGTTKISTQEIDKVLSEFSEYQLSKTLVEARQYQNHQLLYVHLPDRTLVYDAAASAEMQQPVWFIVTSAAAGYAQYRARYMIWCHDKWLISDPQSNAIGYFVDEVGTHWGAHVRWQFNTIIAYNDGNGALFNRLELVALTGRVQNNPIISTQYSIDGVVWSQPRDIRAGGTGNRTARLVWWRQGHMRNWRIQRFYGFTDAHLSFARLEAQLEPLAW